MKRAEGLSFQTVVRGLPHASKVDRNSSQGFVTVGLDRV